MLDLFFSIITTAQIGVFLHEPPATAFAKEEKIDSSKGHILSLHLGPLTHHLPPQTSAKGCTHTVCSYGTCGPFALERGLHPWPARLFSRELNCPQNQGENVTLQADWQEPTRNTQWEGGGLSGAWRIGTVVLPSVRSGWNACCLGSDTHSFLSPGGLCFYP